MIWGDISRSVNGENVLGGVAYKNILTTLKTAHFTYYEIRKLFVGLTLCATVQCFGLFKL